MLKCTVHKTVHRLPCYMNIPKYSKLFIQIVRETSVRGTSCKGNNRRVMALRRPGNVFPGNVLSGKVIVRETSVTRIIYWGAPESCIILMHFSRKLLLQQCKYSRTVNCKTKSKAIFVTGNRSCSCVVNV